MYTVQACNLTNGTSPYNPGRGPAQRARLEAGTQKANGAYSALLCRNPRDFVRYGLNVAKDVSDVNVQTGCTSESGTSASPAASGDAAAAAAIASIVAAAGGNAGPGGARSPNAGSGAVRGGSDSPSYNPGSSCDLSGGVSVVPLNGPGGGGLPAVSAAPAKLTTTAGLPKSGMGRYKGMGCCSDLVWGDAFPNGAPAASVAASISTWVANNPWLAAGLAAAGLFLVSKGGKRG